MFELLMVCWSVCLSVCLFFLLLTETYLPETLDTRLSPDTNRLNFGTNPDLDLDTESIFPRL